MAYNYSPFWQNVCRQFAHTAIETEEPGYMLEMPASRAAALMDSGVLSEVNIHHRYNCPTGNFSDAECNLWILFAQTFREGWKFGGISIEKFSPDEDRLQAEFTKRCPQDIAPDDLLYLSITRAGAIKDSAILCETLSESEFAQLNDKFSAAEKKLWELFRQAFRIGQSHRYEGCDK